MKLLIVEDHAVVREGVSRLLSMHFPATVSETDDIATALEIYNEQKRDLVWREVNLAGVRGLKMMGRWVGGDQAAEELM